MISRINFTNRRRIQRAVINIHVYPGEPRTFDAALGLDDVGFPGSAAVVLEATSAGSPAVQRFEFGTVGALKPPPNRRLDEISGDNVLFTVKVVDRSRDVGRLLGLAEGVRPTRTDRADRGRVPLLPVNPVDLGQRVWKLSYHESGVYLDVNYRIPQIKDTVRGDERFIALTYPEIVRQVIERVVTVDGHGEVSEDVDDWRDLWLRFGISWHPDHRQVPPLSEPIDTVMREEFEQWLDEVIDAFSRHYQFADRFAARMDRDE